MKLKRIIAVFVLLCMVACMLPLMQTNAATIEGDYTYEIVDGCTTITRYIGDGGDIIIPSFLGGRPVTTIGDSSFANNSRLTSIVIPGGVTSISQYAFYKCTNLTSVTIPDSVQSIGSQAFYRCSSLSDVTIPNGVTCIKRGLFGACGSLTNITIPDSVTQIEDGAFDHCGNLSEIVIPESVTFIGQDAFYNSGIVSVTIPSSVTQIDEDAFMYCTKLKYVNITDIAAWCNILFESFQASPCYYGDLYLNGELVTDVTIPEGTSSIGAYAFAMRESLASITIPSSVTEVGYAAFVSSGLNTVTYCGTEEQWKTINIQYNNDSLTRATRRYHAYQAATCTTPKICTICGTTEGAALGHSGKWLTVQDATCVENGVQTRICDVCQQTETETIVAKGHDYHSIVTSPTCTQQGYTTHSCTACGNSYVDSYVAGGHQYQSVVTAPTCTEQGYTTHTCAACGDSFVDTYVEAGHSYESVVTEPTCTEQGYTTHTCATCGDGFVDSYVDATGHSYENNVCIGCGDMICTAHTWENGVCSVCGQNLEEAIELSGDGKITAFDAQILAEAQAGLRTLTDEQWQALGALKVSDIIDYILGRFPGMKTEE